MTKIVKNKILYQLNFLKSISCEYHGPLKFFNKNISSNSLPNDIDELRLIVENCYLCELSKSRKNVLFGWGNKNASLMFISDEPTVSEDEFKSFYVGKAGKQLAKMIENVLPLKKEDVYITNLVKCRSLNQFTISHYNSCNTYLYKEIKIINPKLIVTLGQKAYQFLKNDSRVFSEIRGQLQTFKKFNLLPIDSPSFLLRNPSAKKEAFDDMLKIKSILEFN